ncbi:MAG: von Willebrand factor type A domain-containing protein [Cyclobacteriaceae bacterium]|nr:von Willebrand factor type A domain-containing protein [Cyclobacteriaceae bacterium]
MKTVRLTLVLALIVFLANAVNATQIKGVVLDAGTKSPINRAKVTVAGRAGSAFTNTKGEFTIEALSGDILVIEKENYNLQKIRVSKSFYIKVMLTVKLPKPEKEIADEEDVMMDMAAPREKKAYGVRSSAPSSIIYQGNGFDNSQNWNTEEYSTIHENGYKNPTDDPLSTFSIDVDAASYSNVRRFLNNGQRPPKDAVRIEELINYFNYDYAEPKGEEVFSVNTEVAMAPWNPTHQLVQIGIQGKNIATDRLPSSNLVFLLDVSGSMNSPNKLPLLKSAMKLLVGKLREGDKVSIVVYAGAAGLVLPPTDGENKEAIIEALDKLSAGGSTAGGAGIMLAYKTAREQFIEGGNNRIILATDGDFNIGASSNAEMERLIEKERESGVFLTVLGFGMGNYKDSKMEILADKGNGNYAYIDNLLEAKKVLVNEFGGTLFTIAKDVKIQVEFNPSLVQSYRLIGYENRLLNKEDFNDDKKDAGELGAGHTVTALYEIVPAGAEFENKSVDPLKYQEQMQQVKAGKYSNELMTVKIRYKEPDGDKSKLLTHTIKNSDKSWKQASANFQWAAAIAEFGMILRDSEYIETDSYAQVLELANASKGKDEFGYRAEFIRLIQSAELLTRK